MLLLSVGPLRSERCCFLGCSKPLQTWKPENRLCFYIVEKVNSDTKQKTGYSMRSNLICMGGTRIQVPNGYTINMCTFAFLNCLTFIVYYYFYFSEAHHLPLELFPVYGLKCTDAVQPAITTIRSKDTLYNPTLKPGMERLLSCSRDPQPPDTQLPLTPAPGGRVCHLLLAFTGTHIDIYK